MGAEALIYALSLVCSGLVVLPPAPAAMTPATAIVTVSNLPLCSRLIERNRQRPFIVRCTDLDANVPVAGNFNLDSGPSCAIAPPGDSLTVSGRCGHRLVYDVFMEGGAPRLTE